MKKTAFLLLIILFSLCSCSKLYEGIVVEKRYTPALTYGQYGPPFDEYMLKIEGDMNSKIKTKKVYVSKQTYDSIEVGDIYLLNE
ncbi:MAG: hypothetical protein ABFS16_07865 [Bacteroidota bacterium]